MSDDMMNTKIYSSYIADAKAFALLCGVENVMADDAGIIGYGFNQRGKDANCVIGFQAGSGFDDGEFNGVEFTEIPLSDFREKLLNQVRTKKTP